ncbi:MAG: GspH/FimT family protein [Desulfocapsaceae bacterium]|nr:GspH/FimT family protein [Desulfocapsaceae bacterium]
MGIPLTFMGSFVFNSIIKKIFKPSFKDERKMKNPGKNLLNSNLGFTLIEIIVVIVIIGILLGIAYPFFATWLANINVQTVSRQVQLDLMWAKAEAISLNSNVVMVVNAVGGPGGCAVSGGSYTIFADNGAGGGTAGDNIQNGTEPTLKTVILPATGGPCVNTSQGQLIGFTSRGLPLSGMTPFLDANGNQIVGSISIASTKTTEKFTTSIKVAGSITTQAQ